VDADRFRRPVLYVHPDPKEIERTSGLAYAATDDTYRTMDVYRSAALGPSAPAPAVLFVHGGPIPADLPLSPTEWGVFRSYGALAAAAGFVGMTFNHRFHRMSDLGRAADDVDAAIACVRARGPELGADPDRLAVWAFSGGGPLLTRFLPRAPSYVRCLVAYYAALDLRELPEEFADGLPREALDTLSPAAHVGAGSPPVLVARAGRDRPGLNGSIDGFARAALAANAEITLVNHPNGQHSFDVLDDVPRTREIIAATFAFLREHLSAPREE
jgi:acetyl esterase/lipase